MSAAIVLLHGSWLGGWSWRFVLRRLRARGLTASAPTMLGFAERVSPNIAPTLATLTEDLATQVVDVHARRPLILMAHSFGGVAAHLLAEHLGAQVRRFLFLDAVLPAADRSVADVYPPERVAQARADAARDGLVPPLSPYALGVPQRLARLSHAVAARLRPMPLSVLEEPVRFGASVAAAPRMMVYCTQTLPTIAPFAAQAAASGHPVRTIESGHLPMLTHPCEVVDAFAALGGFDG